MAGVRAQGQERGACRVLVVQPGRRRCAARLCRRAPRSGLRGRAGRGHRDLPAQSAVRCARGSHAQRGIAMKSGHWWALATTGTLGLGLLALCVRGPLPVDETRYLAVAWEMWDRGSFLLPLLNGEPYAHKPPLLFW